MNVLFFIASGLGFYPMLCSDRGYSSSIGGEMEDMTTGVGLSTVDEDCNTGYALVINGHSLVYALQPKLEKLFLDVGTQCEYCYYYYY